MRHLIIILFLTGVAAIPESMSQGTTDVDVKAALVFKFSGYVRWPGEIMNNDVKNFQWCVLGKSRLFDHLSQFDGEKFMKKTIRVKRISDIKALDDCNLLFISSSEKNNLPEIFKTLEGKPILTVGNMKGFAKNGGIVNFVRKKDSVHFEINPEAGKRAGLKISSKLLRLAKIVGDK